MWQRKQTIFLILTALCMGLTIFFPIWIGEDATREYLLFPLHYTIKAGELREPHYWPYALCATLAAAAATTAVMEILKFEDRMSQMKMGALNSLFMAGALGTAVYFATKLMSTTGIEGRYGWALYLPAIAMISNLIANRFIRRDEKLVRDADRIR